MLVLETSLDQMAADHARSVLEFSSNKKKEIRVIDQDIIECQCLLAEWVVGKIRRKKKKPHTRFRI